MLLGAGLPDHVDLLNFRVSVGQQQPVNIDVEMKGADLTGVTAKMVADAINKQLGASVASAVGSAITIQSLTSGQQRQLAQVRQPIYSKVRGVRGDVVHTSDFFDEPEYGCDLRSLLRKR